MLAGLHLAREVLNVRINVDGTQEADKVSILRKKRGQFQEWCIG